MRTLRAKYLSDIPIHEDNYKVDFIILDKYQNFSSEILRLSLLGLAIYGFLITDVIFKITNSKALYSFSANKLLFFLGAVALILTALVALGHRYFSTDCMTHFIRGFRLRQRLSEIKNGVIKNDSKLVQIEESIKSEEISFESDLNNCKWLLMASGLFLITGILLIVIALAISFNDLLIIKQL